MKYVYNGMEESVLRNEKYASNALRYWQLWNATKDDKNSNNNNADSLIYKFNISENVQHEA